MTTQRDTFDWDVVVDRMGAKKLMPVLSNRVILDLLFEDMSLYDHMISQCIQEVYGYRLEPQPESIFDESNHLPGELDNLLVHAAQYHLILNRGKGASTKTKYLNHMKQELLKKITADYATLALTDSAKAARLLPADVLARVNDTLAQYRSVAELVMKECTYGDYIGDSATHPICRLVHLRIPIYLTTSYFRFLDYILRSPQVNRPAQTMAFCWNDTLINQIPKEQRIVANLDPTWENPLIYHFFGLDEYPASLVLTEDDHLEFLENWLGTFNDQDKTPECVRTAICSDAYPVLLGYDLYSWELRTIWRVLLKHSSNRYGGLAIQLDPAQLTRKSAAFAENLREYMQLHFELAQLDIVWATPNEFIDRLYTQAGR